MDKCGCGKVAEKGDQFCRICGEELTLIGDSFLCECGAEVDKDDCFCHGCGAKFDGIEEEEEFLSKSNCTTCGNPF
ncbi:MAG: hypothetical protein ABIG89_00700 [Candidatus Woesearchaeota archaeon]